jgi:DNA-binding transcriptional LysR family regulator
MNATGPEIRVQTLMQERFVGVVRKGHPALKGKMDVARFAALSHVSASRRGKMRGPIDDALAARGLTRRVNFVVPTFYAALFAAAASDIVAALPRGLVFRARELGLAVDHFDLPVPVPTLSIGQSWHPRFDTDGAHRWLRQTVRAAFLDAQEKGGGKRRR